MQLRGHFILGIFPEKLDIAPQRHHGKAVIRIADFFVQQFRRETQGEGVHPHPEEFGHKEVAQFVDEDQDSQDDDGRQNGYHKSLYAPVGEIVIMSVGDQGAPGGAKSPGRSILGQNPGPSG